MVCLLPDRPVREEVLESWEAGSDRQFGVLDIGRMDYKVGRGQGPWLHGERCGQRRDGARPSGGEGAVQEPCLGPEQSQGRAPTMRCHRALDYKWPSSFLCPALPSWSRARPYLRFLLWTPDSHLGRNVPPYLRGNPGRLARPRACCGQVPASLLLMNVASRACNVNVHERWALKLAFLFNVCTFKLYFRRAREQVMKWALGVRGWWGVAL